MKVLNLKIEAATYEALHTMLRGLMGAMIDHKQDFCRQDIPSSEGGGFGRFRIIDNDAEQSEYRGDVEPQIVTLNQTTARCKYCGEHLAALTEVMILILPDTEPVYFCKGLDNSAQEDTCYGKWV